MDEFIKGFLADLAISYVLYIRSIVTGVASYLSRRENNELDVQRNDMRER